MHKYFFMLIFQENFFGENCAGESCEEGNLNVSIKTEEVCIDENFAHCFLLFVIYQNSLVPIFFPLIGKLYCKSDKRRIS